MKLLALVHKRAGCLDEAREIQLQVMKYRMQLECFGDKHPQTYRIIEASGDTYRKLGDITHAEQLASLWRQLRLLNGPTGDEDGTDPAEVITKVSDNIVSSHILCSSSSWVPLITFSTLFLYSHPKYWSRWFIHWFFQLCPAIQPAGIVYLRNS